MKTNIFVAKLAGGAAATALVSSAVIPAQHSNAALLPPLEAQVSTFPSRSILPESNQEVSIAEKYVLSFSQPPSAWSNKLEREFRALALQEATSKISKKDGHRLEQLSHWREQLLNPKTVDEIMIQLRRDSLLTRMEKLLLEYVEFQEASYQKGKPS